MTDLTNGADVEARTNKNIQVPFSQKQAKELKLYKIIMIAEIAIIVLLVAMRWFVGGWWISWDVSSGSETVRQPDASETTSAADLAVDPSIFEANAIVGTPVVDAKLGWSVLNVQSGYDVHVCSVLTADADGKLPIWFTSKHTNTVWVKLRVLDENGDVLGETGILKPGEYVEYLQLKEGTHSCSVTVQIMGYDENTNSPIGNVSLANTLVVAN